MALLGDRGEAWFAALYAAHRRDVIRYGLRRLGDARAAEELAQEVFVIAWRRRTQVPEPGLPWLYGVARRVLANDRRSHRTAPDPVGLNDPDRLPASAGQHGPDAVAGALDLHAALAKLPEADQEILRLVGWEQLTVAEAAIVLDCGSTAARVRLHRARRRLRAALADPEPPRTSAAPSLAAPEHRAEGPPVARRRLDELNRLEVPQPSPTQQRRS